MAKQTILIAEDDPDQRFLLTKIVELKGGMRTIDTHDGECAIVLARDQKPDLVVLDVMLHGLVDGLDVARELRADPRTAHIPILMLSGRTWPEARQAGLDQGADEYMGKPYNSNHLMERIRALLHTAAARAEDSNPKEAVLQ